MWFSARICACLLPVAILIAAPDSSTFAAESSYRLIEKAFAEGKFSQQTKLLLAVQSVKDQASLPAEFRSSVLEVRKCATEIFKEVKENWKSFSAQEQSVLLSYLARPPATAEYNSASGNFKIHYNTSGGNAVPLTDVSPVNGVPDYIEWIAAYCDSSYHTEIDILGHRVPPSDGGLGGDTRYDIYTEEMPYYGYTQAEGTGPNPWNDAYSYISVHRNFFGFPPNEDPDGDQKGAAKVTVAHEFYHAIQFAYDYNEHVWFMEATATWMEDVVYDVVNDNYNYLSDFFSFPDYSLHATSGLHLYAAFIWPKYLEQRFGSALMPQLWEQLISAIPYPGMTTVLGTYGANLSDELANFCVFNFITGSRDDGLHHEEGSHYPLISLVRTHTTYPVINQTPLAGKSPDAMGANYILFNLPSGPGDFQIDFN